MLQLVLVWCCPGLAGSWGGSSGNLFTPPKKLILGPTCSRDPQFSVLSLWAGGSPSTGDKKNLLPHCWEFPAPFFSLGTPTLMVLSSQKSLCLLPWQGSFPSHPHRAHLAPSSSSFPTCVGAPAGLLPPSPELFLKHPFFPSIFLPLVPVSGVYLGPALPFPAPGCSFPHLQLLSPGSIPSWGHCDPCPASSPTFPSPWICL